MLALGFGGNEAADKMAKTGSRQGCRGGETAEDDGGQDG